MNYYVLIFTRELKNKLAGEYEKITEDMTSMLSVPMNLDKIAIPNISTASFTIPNAAVSPTATSGIMSSVTNNEYNSTNNVTINAAGQPVSADMVTRALKFASESQVG